MDIGITTTICSMLAQSNNKYLNEECIENTIIIMNKQ